MYSESTKILQRDLQIFLITVSALIIAGILFIYSASSIYALESFNNAHYFIQKHFMGLFLGVIGLTLFSFLPLKFLQKFSPLLFLFSLGLTALTLTHFGQIIHGSSRWIHIIGFSFQPSELLKLTLPLYISHFFTKKNIPYVSSFQSYVQLLCITLLIGLILLKQPDFGLTVTLSFTILLLYFIMHTQKKHILYSLSLSIPLILYLILSQPYRIKRILVFLNPWHDPQGSGFQIIQSLIAIGSGGLWGLGISQSKQKFFYLPMHHTDFIFSIIAEEIGFIGSLILIFLYLSFLYFGLRLAGKMKTSFSALTISGYIFLLSLQTIVNLAVSTGLAPTKGIGLPFISSGNSSLIVNLCIIGVIINCVKSNYKN